MTDTLEYSKVFYENDIKDLQWRLTVSFFKGQYYLNIRKYFLTFEEDYQPTKEGMTIPLELSSTYSLISGLLDILSEAEKESLQKVFLNEPGQDKSIAG